MAQPAATSSDSDHAQPWGPFLPILAVQFIGTLGFSIAVPFLVFLVDDFGGAPWTYGVVGATYSACQLIGAPLLGRWSDRVGRRPVLILSQGGTLVAWALFAVALMLPVMELGRWAGATITLPLLLVFVARALDGLTGGNMSVASAFVADLTRDDETARGVAFGRMGMAASLGFALGPAAAGLLGATSWGYMAPVVAATAVSAVAMVMCFALREPEGRCPEGPEPPPAVARVLGQQYKRCDRAEPHLGPAALTQPLVVLLLVATFALFLAFNLFYAGFPVHAQAALGWDAGRMGLFFTVMSGMMIVAQGPLLRWANAKLQPRTVFFVGMGGLTASFAAFAVDHPMAPFAGAALFAIGNGLAWPTFQARLSSVVGPEDQGAIQGAATSAGACASIVGLIVGGILYPWLGATLFIAGAGLFAVVAAATPAWFADREGAESR